MLCGCCCGSLCASPNARYIYNIPDAYMYIVLVVKTWALSMLELILKYSLMGLLSFFSCDLVGFWMFFFSSGDKAESIFRNHSETHESMQLQC